MTVHPRLRTRRAAHPSARLSTRRPGARLALALLAVLLLPVLPVVGAPAAGAATPLEEQLAALVNAERTAAGKPPLEHSVGMTALASGWSARMAAGGGFVHNPSLRAQVEASVTTSWRRLAENIAYAGSLEAAHRALMDSSGHRANILGDFTHLGTGVVVAADGTTWVTETFLTTGASLPSVLPTVPAGPPPPPAGALDAVVVDRGGVAAAGWAHTPGSTEPVAVRLTVDGADAGRQLADAPRPDITRSTAGSARHGFTLQGRLRPGRHQICVVADAVGGSTTLGCSDVTATGRRLRASA